MLMKKYFVWEVYTLKRERLSLHWLHIWSVLQYSGDIMKSMKFLKYSLTFDNSKDSNKSDLLFEYKER